MAYGVPYRILVGSEEAKLASSQDKRTWNERVQKRRDNYLTPMVVRPFVDRLIALGKRFDYFVYPNRDHGLSEGEGTRVHVQMRIARHLVEHLPAGPR